MQHEKDFPQSFMKRTQKNLESYRGEYEATQLINSLLGLLIVPKETLFDRIPATPLTTLNAAEWGRLPDWLTQPTKCDLGHVHVLTLRQFVRKLRNSVAHFHIQPFPESGHIEGFRFSDNKFQAEIPVEDLKRFVIQLAFVLGSS